MQQYGLIGYPLSHSFSKRYFTEKFEVEQIPDSNYELFPLKQISDFPSLLEAQPNLVGLNVTIPYKLEVFEYLDEIEAEAAAIGAVNTIKFQNGKLKGFNTDVYGFEKSLVTFLDKTTTKIANLQALVLGTGGASRAIVYAFKKLGIAYKMVSRSAAKGDLTYEDIDAAVIQAHQIIVNTTPLGTAPNVDTAPDLPYANIGEQHYCYDLVYNPEITLFLKRAADNGAKTINGLEMLHLQAEKAWEIWQRTD